MSIVNQIRLIAASLNDGDSDRVLCPACNGGSTQEKSLSISRMTDIILYQCFRASCSCSGAVGGVYAHDSQREASRRKRRSWEGKVYSLPSKVRTIIQDTWRIYPPPEDWYWTTDFGGRIAMCMWGPKGQQIGWLLRAVRKDHEPKALTFCSEEGMSWYMKDPELPTVIVEDIPSAVRAVEHCNSVALAGTGIGLERAALLARFAARPILLALDEDATDKSFRYLQKYQLLWGEAEVIPLKKDLKDCTEEELERVLYERIERAVQRDKGPGGL